MVLLAAFDVVLHRWCGQDDVVVGTPVAGRLRPEVEGLIGFFANSLVLRADCGGDPGFGELVGRVREVCLGAYAHQEVPFERIVEELRPVRDLARAPVFQVMFALQNAPAAVVEFPGLRLEPFDVDTGAAKFDLSVMLTPRAGGGLGVSVEYNTDLFDAGTVGWLVGAWQRVLAAGVRRPECRLSALPLLDEGQAARLAVWGRGPRVAVDDRSVVGLVEAQAARTPDAVAVGGYTYRELVARVARWAWHLRGLGVGTESRVGVCLPRDADLVVALLAVLKAGAAYVPVDPAYPAARIGFMLEDCAAVCVLSTAGLAGVLPVGVRQVLMEELPPAGGPLPPVPDDQLAYVIYTSGSTGVPKGVGVEHRALRSFLTSMLEVTGIGPDDVMAAVTTVSFDIAGLELFLPLSVGARVVVVPRESTMDGAELAALISKHGVSMMQATPATWQLLLDAAPELPDRFTALCGGDVLTPELAQRIPARLINLYGPTETTIWSTADPHGTSLGRPIGNTHVAVLDAHGKPVPIGARGELVIGGHGVARGYLARPALTAQRFRPDPTGTGTRIYHTGDLARWRPDATLAFLGRADNQIKVRGHRVEPGEIEAALRTHPTIHDAAVIAKPDPTGTTTQLIAYHTGHTNPQHLRTHLRDHLPEYMLPNIYIPLDTLPLTPNGKLDRNALPEPGATPVADRVEPRDEVEAWLAGIWAEVLGQPAVGVHDDFFDLGGHSLMATRVVTRLRQRLGVPVPLRLLFEHTTIAELARALPASGVGTAMQIPKQTRTRYGM
jgi:amino acid adenylation domain-containing protein